MASTYLTKTFAQAGNRRTFTISYWIKMGIVSTGADQAIMGAAQDGSNSDDLYIHTGRLNFSGYYGSTAYQVRTTAKYRDLSGWYHHVIRFDSTQSTASDRLRLYVNGELQTALDSNTYPSQNLETTYFNTARQHTIGSIAYGMPNLAFNGSMSHFHFCDGYSYGADSFGSTDSTTGEWKINTNPSVTYGTNGFFILKDGNSVTDQSGNGNNWTVAGGTLTKTEDNPSNVFATMNPLSCSSYGSLTNGNTSVAGNNNADVAQFFSTLSTGKTGKYYIEAKVTGYTGTRPGFGIGNDDNPNIGKNVTGGTAMTGEGNFTSPSFNYRLDGAIRVNGSTTATYSTFTIGDIISIAVDMDNGASYVAKNGTWQNSGNPASGGSKTGAITTWTAGSISGFLINADIYYGASSTGGHADADFNFGNGYFGTTAVASAGTNASGIGIFEYDVPTGYTALSTKGLNE